MQFLFRISCYFFEAPLTFRPSAQVGDGVTWAATGLFYTVLRLRACFLARRPGFIFHPPGSAALATNNRKCALFWTSPWDLANALQHTTVLHTVLGTVSSTISRWQAHGKCLGKSSKWMDPWGPAEVNICQTQITQFQVVFKTIIWALALPSGSCIFKNTIYRNIGKGILTNSGIICRAITANTSNDAGKENIASGAGICPLACALC